MSSSIELIDATLETASGVKVAAREALAGKIVALYFSAKWCDDCEVATPKVAVCHEMANEDEDMNFQVVFVSSDTTAEAQAEYMEKEHGDWLRVSFDDPLRSELKRKYGCFAGKEQALFPDVERRNGIPSLVVVGPSGEELVFGALEHVEKKGPVAVNEWEEHRWP